MKYLFSLFFMVFLLVGCSGESDTPETNTASDVSSFFLVYNDTADGISGQVSFYMENIPNNHIITLSDFIPVVEGCSIDTLSSTISPESINFSSLNQTGTATVNLKFLSPCSNTKLTLETKQKDSSVLGHKLIVNTQDKSYQFLVQKAPVTPNSFTSVLQESSITITKNLETANVVLSVYDALNTPVKDGTVKIIYPNIVTTGVNIGSFSPTEAAIKDGKATFLYTSPSDLIQTLKDTNSTSFQFIYNDIVTNATKLEVFFVPEANQTIQKKYAIAFLPQDDTYSMSLEETKTFSVSIVDDENIAVLDENVQELNISLENINIANILDFAGANSKSFTQNNITLTLKSNTISGLVPIQVDARFLDVNGEEQNISDTFNIVVKSGPPTAISISYTSTDQDKERGKFIENFAISVTDKYFNPINTNPQVSVGAIVGYAKFQDDGLSANSDKRVYVDSGVATLSDNKLTIDTSVTIDQNNTIDTANDVLVTFGNSYRYEASGVWEIEDVDVNTNTLTLASGQYDINETKELGFAIGNNHRQDACNFGTEWLGQTKLKDGVTTLDETGTAVVELFYDYYLVGKDIVLYINIIGKDNTLNATLKIGEAKKHTLRGHGLEYLGDNTFSVDGGVNAPTTATHTFNEIWIKDTDVPYRNARFAFRKVGESGKGRISSVTRNSISNCSNGGRSYVSYTVTADINETYSITVSDPQIMSEF